MTTEAEKYLRSLVKANPNIVFQWVEERGEISSVILKRTELNKIMVDRLLYFAKNGSPEIVIKWKGENDLADTNGISAPFIFIDECKSPEFSSSFQSESDHLTDALSYRKGPSGFHIKHLEKLEKKLEVSYTELELKHAEWSYFTKNHLYQLLLERESQEDFEECAQIRDYAASKGWELKK